MNILLAVWVATHTTKYAHFILLMIMIINAGNCQKMVKFRLALGSHEIQ